MQAQTNTQLDVMVDVDPMDIDEDYGYNVLGLNNPDDDDAPTSSINSRQKPVQPSVKPVKEYYKGAAKTYVSMHHARPWDLRAGYNFAVWRFQSRLLSANPTCMSSYYVLRAAFASEPINERYVTHHRRSRPGNQDTWPPPHHADDLRELYEDCDSDVEAEPSSETRLHLEPNQRNDNPPASSKPANAAEKAKQKRRDREVKRPQASVDANIAPQLEDVHALPNARLVEVSLDGPSQTIVDIDDRVVAKASEAINGAARQI
ncbi:hypothetical protein B0H19DRAFT_1371322 [Mycena capillaripes]|nr:hypothetical protein B0H19DRAFT_1371322 [Mycena capillaripes]